MGKCLGAYLMPHPPILVGDLGGKEAAKGRATIKGMIRAGKEIAASGSDLIVVLTPHGCQHPEALAVRQGDDVKGHMGKFGRRDIALAIDHAGDLAQDFLRLGQEMGLALKPISPQTALDHGAFVPLYFVYEAGFRGRVLHLVTGWPGLDDEETLGGILREILDGGQEDWSLIISGDLSHYLDVHGPYGYREAGMVFEQKMEDIIRAGNLEALDQFSDREIHDAGQCGLAPLRIGRALFGHDLDTSIYSHEWPFGVGYMVARLRAKEEEGHV